jgi:microcystin degradation protein MlrC
MKRIAYGRVAQETNAFSPVDSTFEDFRRFHYLEGEALARACSRSEAEVPGLTRAAELSGFVRAVRSWREPIEAVPLLSAWAMPSGPLAESGYEELRSRLTRALEGAGRLDGLYLALHGAMRGRPPLPEPEEALLAAVRSVVGKELPLAVTYDLHANLTPGKVDPVTVLCNYRTNPHRDLASTGRRAGMLLLRAVAGEVRPVTRWRSLPMVLGGGTTVDLLAPMRPIFRRMKAIECDPRVLSVGLNMCHPWNDSRDLGWSVYVTTDGDAVLADTLADELANRAWAVRGIPPPRFLEPEEAILAVRSARVARALGTVCVVDASDVTAAGAPGENTNLLRAFLERGEGLSTYIPVRDARAVLELWEQPLGSRVRTSIGGRVDPGRNTPVEVSGTLRARCETGYSGRAVALDLGHVQLVVTEHAPLTLKPSFYTALGLSPWRADAVVVKSLFHFRLYFLAVNRKTLMVKTRGATDLDLATKIPTNDPVSPRDAVADWRPADARRRGAHAPLPAAAGPG